MTFIDPVTPVAAAVFVPPPAYPAPAFVEPCPASPSACLVDVERHEDAEDRESLLDRAFGPARFAKTCERLRSGRLPAVGLSLVARPSGARHRSGGGAAAEGAGGADRLVGTVRLWHVAAGAVPALMLGPLAVDEAWRCHRVGAALMQAAIERARALGHGAIILVGDAPYYARFGFARRCTLGLRMPGPVEADRFLGLELEPGALRAATGLVQPTGAVALAPERRSGSTRAAA